MRTHFYCIAITPLVVGASIARPRGLPGRLAITGGLPGRHICRPYGVPVILQSPPISPSSVTCGDSFPQRGKPFFGGAVRRERVGGASKNVS